ncbi:unnamed protein product [marine sediment metagenome]|uniref:Uncharacterized protein n=1 Tax=marine sediment metagenome TaxID=412755 RepID=X0UUD0_9ZZZZ
MRPDPTITYLYYLYLYYLDEVDGKEWLSGIDGVLRLKVSGLRDSLQTLHKRE